MKNFIRLTLAVSLVVFPAASFAATMGKVVRILDGRTVAVDIAGTQLPVRLTGVDIPGGVDSSGKSYESAAADYLSIELNGRFVMIEYDPATPRTDRDGKTLAYLYRSPDGLFVNREAVRRGTAVVGREACSLGAALADAERQARAIGAGYWSANAGASSLAGTSRMTFLGTIDPEQAAAGGARSSTRSYSSSARKTTGGTASRANGSASSTGAARTSRSSRRQQPIVVIVETSPQQ